MTVRAIETAPPARRTASAASALAALTLATFSFVTAENLPIGLLPLLVDDLDVSLPTAGRLVTGYGLTVAAASVPLALLTRRIPRRYLLTGVLAAYVATTLVSALATSYWMLLAARIGTALAQAVFWAVVAPTAAGLFPAAVRGRAISTLFLGASLASVLGLPAGTWLGQQAGWRTAFATASGLGLLTMAAVASLLPTEPAGQGETATGSIPDGRRYTVLVTTTVLAAGGAFTAYTYISPFLTQVSGFRSIAVSPILMASGIAGAVGNVAVGIVFDRSPRIGLIAPVVLLTAVLLGLYLLGATPYAGATLTALWGMSIGALATALQSRVLQVAPGRTDLASAGNSAAFSFGIASGAGIGSAVLATFGVRAVAGAGAVLTCVALAVLLSEPVFAATGRGRLSGTRGGPPRAAAGTRQPAASPRWRRPR